MKTKVTDRRFESSPFLDVAELIHSEWDRIEGQAMAAGQSDQDPAAEIDSAVQEIAVLIERKLRVRVQLGAELFRFTSLAHWANKASVWFRRAELRDGYGYVCVDAKGRICQVGKHFMRARDEDSFPVVVYAIED